MQILTQTYNCKLSENVANKNVFRERCGLKFQTPKFNILCKISFWNIESD